MGTRQLRLNDPALVRQKIGGFVGKNITIVLRDSNVVFGVLMRVDEKEILLSNMRLKKIIYPLDNIAEVYLDAKT